MNNEPIFINDLRTDGRRALENRHIEIQTDTIKEATGSCEYTLGETKVVAWIEGPKECKKITQDNIGTIKCIFTQAPFSYKTRKNIFKRDLKMRDFSKVLKEIFEQVIRLELYSKSEIIINVLVLENDGNFKSASINAATIALINAGIYIKDTVVGMNVGDYQDSILSDLLLSEEKNDIPILNVAFLPHSQKFIFTELLNARTKYGKIEELMKEAQNAALNIYEEEEKFLKEQYKLYK